MEGVKRISIILSAFMTSIVITFLLVFELIEKSNMVYIVLLLVSTTYGILYIFLNKLLYVDLGEIERVLEESKSRRAEEINVGRNRFSIIRIIIAKLIKHLYRNQEKVDELEKLAAFRKGFIADVSHELKTPIFAAQGFVHTLLDGAVEDKEVRTRFLEKAAKSLDSLDMLVHDLLTLSNIEIGEIKMQFEYFALDGLVGEVVDQFKNRAEKKGIVLGFKGNRDTAIVFADWFRVKQVLNNLISNGINYTKEGGEVVIELHQDKDKVMVLIKDSGVGIPKKDLGRIFERFYRVDKSRSREMGGTGLGLAIVKHILEGHESTIEVTSKEGEGSTFEFNLPKGKG